MKLNKKALALLILPISLSTLAVTDLQLTGAFKTIKDVSINPVAGHDMAINGLQMTSGSSCTVATPALLANWPGDTLMKASNTGGSTAAPQATYGATTGAGCTTGTSVPGIYEIDGSPGAQVTVTVLNTSANGINFVPVGCVINHSGSADNDTCSPIDNATAPTISLASTADETVSAGNGQPEQGIARMVLAGTVTSTIGLAAGASINVPFDITVVY